MTLDDILLSAVSRYLSIQAIVTTHRSCGCNVTCPSREAAMLVAFAYIGGHQQGLRIDRDVPK